MFASSYPLTDQLVAPAAPNEKRISSCTPLVPKCQVQTRATPLEEDASSTRTPAARKTGIHAQLSIVP